MTILGLIKKNQTKVTEDYLKGGFFPINIGQKHNLNRADLVEVFIHIFFLYPSPTSPGHLGLAFKILGQKITLLKQTYSREHVRSRNVAHFSG